MEPVFSGEVVRAMIFSAVACSLIPLVFLGYYRAKTGAKLLSFFVGMGCYFLFSFFGGSVFNTIFLALFGLQRLLADHPVCLSLYYAFSSGICGVFGLYIGLRFAQKTRPGRQNAFLFGLGAGGLECILYGGIVNITSIVLAVMVNSFGLDGYMEKMQIPGGEWDAQRQLILGRAAIPASSIYMDAILQFLSMCLLASLTILVYGAINRKRSLPLLATAFLLDMTGHIPVNLSQIGVLTNDMATILFITVYVFVILLFVYRFYHSERLSS